VKAETDIDDDDDDASNNRLDVQTKTHNTSDKVVETIWF
jgi:hypothetical protein